MDKQTFLQSLKNDSPPTLTPHLKALWFDAKGDWNKSHELIQDIGDSNAAWIHAYLHRKEGDDGNAGYWYRKAGRSFPALSVDQEWEQILKEILSSEF